MSPDDKLIALFRDSIETHASHGEFLAPILVAAGQRIADSLVRGGQILVCGQAASTINAHYLATLLLDQGGRERPAFPAILLDGNANLYAAIARSYGASELYARQISALGRSGDVLVVFTTTDMAQSLVNAVQAAHRQGLDVILFCGGDRGATAQLLDGNDMEIRVPVAAENLIHEMHLLMSFGLVEQIEDCLFGERYDT